MLTLATVSCSPIVGEYTYRGTVTGTSGGQARALILKEYRDGTVSGKLSIPSSSATDPFSCGSIGGRVDDRRITFYLTTLGDSYLGAKMAVMNSSTGTTVRYKGSIYKNRRCLSGKWHAANDYRSYLRGGAFSFNLTHINGTPVKRRTISADPTLPGKDLEIKGGPAGEDI
ncbi:hypothetical protein CXU20_06070 [Akkermansia muciniphila]|nr:hypothetical protein CXU20_06070 [Akkermansia muciniphila]